MYRSLFFLFFVLSGCKNLDLLTLYDVEIENTEGIDGFTSTEIFTTGGGDEVWGMSGKDAFCNPFRFSSYDASIDYASIEKSGQNSAFAPNRKFYSDASTIKNLRGLGNFLIRETQYGTWQNYFPSAFTQAVKHEGS